MPARVLTRGAYLTVDLSVYFRDPDGDTLAYAAESSDTAVVTASAADATLTLAAVGAQARRRSRWRRGTVRASRPPRSSR
ncbi:hypothetical protein [Candidatus Palauibacter sp.]|uniref:hypothetical protein n=1 Tax=Candidatus Palauibacter sp. TaxID=3101350 RepID=UPI003B51666D